VKENAIDSSIALRKQVKQCNFLMQDVKPGRNPGLFLKCSRNCIARGEEKGDEGGQEERKSGEKRCYRRQDEGTRILFKAEHFTAARSSGGNGGSPATLKELIRG